MLWLTTALMGCDAELAEPDDAPTVEPESAPTPEDSGTPISEEAVEPSCEVDTGAVPSSIFFCLDGMTCPSCDAALPLTIAAYLPCVVDGEIVYGEAPGVSLTYHPELVAPEDITAVIESPNSPYTVTCILEN